MLQAQRMSVGASFVKRYYGETYRRAWADDDAGSHWLPLSSWGSWAIAYGLACGTSLRDVMLDRSARVGRARRGSSGR